MLRGLLILTLSLLTSTGSVVSSADEPEPTVRGKTASQWIDILQKDAKPERRQGALLALGILGPKVPGVVVGISAGLADSDIGV